MLHLISSFGWYGEYLQFGWYLEVGERTNRPKRVWLFLYQKGKGSPVFGSIRSSVSRRRSLAIPRSLQLFLNLFIYILIDLGRKIEETGRRPLINRVGMIHCMYYIYSMIIFINKFEPDDENPGVRMPAIDVFLLKSTARKCKNSSPYLWWILEAHVLFIHRLSHRQAIGVNNILFFLFINIKQGRNEFIQTERQNSHQDPRYDDVIGESLLMDDLLGNRWFELN